MTNSSSSEAMYADCNRALEEAVTHLEEDCIEKVNKYLPLLLYYVQDILDKETFDESTDTWLEKLAFGFCVKYFERDSMEKNIHACCLKLLFFTCKRPSISLKLLKMCSSYMDVNKKICSIDASPSISLDLVIQVVREIFNVYKNDNYRHIKDLKQGIYLSAVNILKSEDVTNPCFILICGLLKDFVSDQAESEVQMIWSTILLLYNKRSLDRLMLFISILANIITCSFIIRKAMFWTMIQAALIFPDPLTRKRGLFVVKVVLDHISKDDFMSSNLDEEGNEVIVFWKKEKCDEGWNIWKTIILLLETLDESQVHVINPVLPLTNDVYSCCVCTDKEDQLLHITWLLVILKRALHHQSKLLNKWALQYCFQKNLEEHLVTSKHGLEFVFGDLMNSLQLTHVYTKESNAPWGTAPQISKLLTNFLRMCLKHLQANQSPFVVQLLEVLNDSKSQTNEMTLVYLTEALSHQMMSSQLGLIEIDKLRKFCVSRIGFYRVEYQKVIFHNLSIFYTTNMGIEESLTSEVMMILAYSIEKGFMTINGKCWSLWSNWLNKMSVDSQQEELEHLSQRILNDSINLLLKSESLNSTLFSISVIFQGLAHPQREIVPLKFLDVIDKMNSNPYLDKYKLSNSLELMNTLLHNLLSFNSPVLSRMITTVLSRSSYILEYLLSMFLEFTAISDNTSYFILQRCMSLLEKVVLLGKSIDHSQIFPVVEQFFEKIYGKFMENLNTLVHLVDNLQSENYSLGIFSSITMLKHYLMWKKTDVKDSSNIFLLVANIINNLDRQTFSGICRKSDIEIYSDFFISDLWVCLTLLSDIPSHNEDELLLQKEKKHLLLENFLSDITIVSYENFLDVVAFGKRFVPMFADDADQLVIIMDCMWKLVKDQARTANSFWGVYRSCIECIFHEIIMLSKNEDLINKTKSIWGNILLEGEKKTNVVNIFTTHCIGVWKRQDDPGKSMMPFTDELIQTATFGSFLVKATHPWDDLIYYLHATGKYDAIQNLRSAHSLNEDVRVVVISFLLQVSSGPSIGAFFNHFKMNLLENAIELGSSRKGYYPNTQVHRKILRVWQLFLSLLTKHMDSFDLQSVLMKLFQCVKKAYQLSIRYLIEWCIIIIIYQDNSLIHPLLEEMDLGSEKQILSITSMMSLASHLAKILQGKHFENFVDQAVPKILPWAHAQHLSSRIHAQVVLQTIWDMIHRNRVKRLQDEFKFLSYCFALKVDSSAAVKNRRELIDHFYYSNFNPIENYSLETIFHKFPAHVGILQDEWVHAEKFDFTIDISNVNEPKLKKENLISIPLPDIADRNEIVSPFEQVDERLRDVQTKTKPWKVLPSTDDFILHSELERKKEMKSSNLVLCAVLVDKVANLGGLCRTAEIFGVASLIVSSSHYVEDKAFKSLSVSAERWLNIEQVLPIKLENYLKEMRSNGYQVVGVEQTANSKKIGEYRFKDKTVLLLGNERTGIPVDLIQLLDECVEIPQLGIIRSLNVHISGAIMMWEYCKQHMLHN